MNRAIIEGTLMAALAVAGLRAAAQTEPAQLPEGATAGEIFATDSRSTEDTGPAVAPDAHPLTGGISAGVGSWGPRHSFIVPGVRAAQLLESDSLLTSSDAFQGYTSAAAELQAVQYFGRGSELRYAGLLRFDSNARLNGGQQFTQLHDFSLTQTVPAGNWSLLAHDEATFSEGAIFGSAGMQGLGSVVTQLSQWNGVSGIGLGSTTIQSGLTPEQSILTQNGERVSNTLLGEVDRRLGDRGVATAGVYYGLLHFLSAGLIDAGQVGGLTGFERAITARDRLGLVYGFTRLYFSGSDQELDTQQGALLYGRKISGMLAVEVGAGPQYTSGSGSYSTLSDLNWQGRGTVDLHLRLLDFELAAIRTLTAGSGVLFGATTNSVQGSVMRRAGRTGNISGRFGYARNAGIQTAETYDTELVGATYTHSLSATVGAFVSYNLQRQTAAGCLPTGCNATGSQQTFGAGLSWTARPMGVR